MAAPTSTYCDYALGNDYKGATFTDGAYVSATKTLTKAGAFAASQVNHWLYLESNDGGAIVAGHYKIATVSSADAVILATDAGAGVDDDAAKCTQHDGTTSKPWRSIQGALDLITRDATNGDQINIKAGTEQVLAASLVLTRYGAPAEGAPLVFRGYTSAAGDGGIGDISLGAYSMFAASNLNAVYGYDLYLHSTSNIWYIDLRNGNQQTFSHCKFENLSGITGSGIYVSLNSGSITNCQFLNLKLGVTANIAKYNYVYNCTTGLSSVRDNSHNIVHNCTTGISVADGSAVDGNSIYHSGASTGTGISASSGNSGSSITNNIIEGYSGSGGIAISGVADIAVLGYNAFYNNATNNSVADVYFDLTSNDAILTASPFTNAAGGDFSLNTAVAGALEAAFPGAWYGPASTTNKADIGAVQKGAGVSGPPGWL